MYGIETHTTNDGAKIEIIRDMWLCSCCTLLHANGECCEDQDEHGAALDRNLAGDTADGWHLASDCPADDEEEGADHLSFTWQRCDGCDSGLGGARYRHSLIRRTAGGAQ